jgi:hypothetical protein
VEPVKGLRAVGTAAAAADGTAIPSVWPDDRYDVIWTPTLDPVAGHYVFGQIQQLLDGATDTVI